MEHFALFVEGDHPALGVLALHCAKKGLPTAWKTTKNPPQHWHFSSLPFHYFEGQEPYWPIEWLENSYMGFEEHTSLGKRLIKQKGWLIHGPTCLEHLKREFESYGGQVVKTKPKASLVIDGKRSEEEDGFQLVQGIYSDTAAPGFPKYFNHASQHLFCLPSGKQNLTFSLISNQKPDLNWLSHYLKGKLTKESPPLILRQPSLKIRVQKNILHLPRPLASVDLRSALYNSLYFLLCHYIADRIFLTPLSAQDFELFHNHLEHLHSGLARTIKNNSFLRINGENP